MFLGFSSLGANAADILPEGVRAAAFVFGSAEGIRDGFNDAGRVESLTRNINRSITLDELAAFEPKLKTLQTALNSLGPNAMGDSLLVANMFADVSVNERHYVSALLWGVTSNLTLGVMVPYIRRDSRAAFKVTAVNNAEKIKGAVGNVPKISDGLDELAATQIDTAVFSKTVFTDNGYKTPTNFSVGGLGDIELEARYGYFKSTYLNLQLRSGVKMPTAQHKADITNVIDRDLDDPYYSYKLGSYHDFKVIPSVLSLNTSVSGVYRRAYRRTTAVAKSADQILPDLHDPEQIVGVTYLKGMLLNAETALVLDIYKGAFSVGVAYVYTQNPKTKVAGPVGLDYSPLTDNTDSVSHVIEVSAELSSIPLFLAGKMPVPGKFLLTWSQPVAGRNTIFTPYGRMDMVMLF